VPSRRICLVKLSAGSRVHCSRMLGLCASAQPAASGRASECNSSGSAQLQAANQAFRPQLSESMSLSGITSFRADRGGTRAGRRRWMPMLRCNSARVPSGRTLRPNIVEYVRVLPRPIMAMALTQRVPELQQIEHLSKVHGEAAGLFARVGTSGYGSVYGGNPRVRWTES
jgi:hypothetical protein